MKQNNHIFWVSYSDLMTSLFFIMLVLFVVTVGYLKVKQRDLKHATAVLQNTRDSLLISSQEKDRLLNLDKQFESLVESGDFDQIGEKYYYEQLRGITIFKERTTDFHPDFDISIVDEAGKKIEAFIQTLDTNMKYLLIIEGNCAKSNLSPQSTPEDSQYGYELSYQRALTIYERWRKMGINLRKKNVEVLICGSGFNGESRDADEDNNKRIVIQIIPKVLYNKSNESNNP